jgi:hypothetical protein
MVQARILNSAFSSIDEARDQRSCSIRSEKHATTAIHLRMSLRDRDHDCGQVSFAEMQRATMEVVEIHQPR